MAPNPVPSAWRPESPFLTEAQWELAVADESPQLESAFESPFAGEHPFLREMEGETETVSPELEFIAEMEQQLYDPEFEDAVARFSAEANGLYQNQLEAFGGNSAY